MGKPCSIPAAWDLGSVAASPCWSSIKLLGGRDLTLLADCSPPDLPDWSLGRPKRAHCARYLLEPARNALKIHP